MTGQFRLEPPVPQPQWIERRRLLRRLQRRFEVPVTVLVAPAGYGKTTILSQAVAGTRGEALRRDVWVQCQPADAEAGELGQAILASAGTPTADRDTADVGVVADALASLAPASVCVILDDFHRLPTGSGGHQLVESLLEQLPANAHLLVSSRVNPSLPLVRRQVAGQVEQLATADLEFDDTEVVVVGGDLLAEIGEAARWPAMASLVLGSPDRRAELGGPVEFLVQEVAARLEPARLAALTAVAHLADVDDTVAAAATDGTASASELLADLPLVQRSTRGSYQMHDLWRQSLAAPGELDAPARAALCRVAQARLDAGTYVEAAELFAAAGSPPGVAAAVHAFAAQPLMFVTSSALDRLRAATQAILPDSPVAGLLERLVVGVAGDEPAAAAAYEELARQAARSGDPVVEALALQNAANMHGILDPTRIPAWLGERADALVAEGHRWALNVTVQVRFHTARLAGEVERAVSILQELVPPASSVELVTHAIGLSDLGRPEQVLAPTGPDANEQAVRAGGQYLAIAMWLRGEVSPETALELGAQLVDSTDEAGFPHLQVPTNSVLSVVALAAGDVVAARQYADAALGRSSATASVQVQVFAALADALCVLTERDEDAAEPLLLEMLRRLPINRWPPRPYLFALPSLYLLAPQVRVPLDACRFGPALTAALDAGRALVALRERGDPEPSTQLAWERPFVLRAHVLPSHLAVLAAAAAAAGHGDVGLLLAALPHCREQLAHAAELTHAPTATWAKARIATLPARPDHELHVGVLGPMRLARGHTEVTDADWQKRDRVRQLLAVLVLRRSVSRRAVAELLWPELPGAKAQSNLRVNLSHLQRVLQPSREPENRPWFVRTDGELLTVADVGLVVDADRFDELHRQARGLDDRGETRRALEVYGAAVDLARGAYMEDWPDAEWAEVERLRLGTLLVSARCRAGELLLARGEPEEAARHAVAVLGRESLQERAGRLLALCLDAQGDRAAAHRLLADLAGRLSAERVSPEPDTVELGRGFGVHRWS